MEKTEFSSLPENIKCCVKENYESNYYEAITSEITFSLLGSATTGKLIPDIERGTENLSIMNEKITKNMAPCKFLFSFFVLFKFFSLVLSQIPLLPEDKKSKQTASLFPKNKYDDFGQQVDLRKENSWLMGVEDVPTVLLKSLLYLLIFDLPDRVG